MSQINLANLGIPELPSGSVIASESPGPKVIMGNTGAGVSSLPNDGWMLF